MFLENSTDVERQWTFSTESLWNYTQDAVVEWLERLAVVRKAAGSSPARAKRLENFLCPPSIEWVPD